MHRLLPIIGYLILAVGVVLGLHQASHAASLGKHAYDGVCAFRQDLIVRKDAAQALLDAHPKAKTIDVDPSPRATLIVGRDTLENSVKNQQLTIDGLTEVQCKEKK